MIAEIGTIIVLEDGSEQEQTKYKSRIVDQLENHILIDYPTQIDTGKTAYFVNGTEVYITFSDKLKQSYAFRAVVTGRVTENQVPMVKLTYPGDDQLIKVQRREFVRVDTPIDVAILTDYSQHQVVAADISAGGMALYLPQDLTYETEENLSLLIVLPFENRETAYIQVVATVIRVWEENQGQRIMSVRFENEISAENRQQIVRFCFERQLAERNEEKAYKD